MSVKNETVQSQTTQYLTFMLREEGFAIEISKVREVLDVTTMTRIPRMPEYLSGVINLRGNVVPVMDLGQKLGMGSIEYTKNTCIMIVELEVDANLVEMGVLTDSVQMVLDLNPEDIESVPKMGTNLNTEFIKGMGRQTEEKFLIILDIDKVLASEGEAALREMDSPASARAVVGATPEETVGAEA
ncbi:MAG: chemotaxis protein CheW [Proteobacteria bacterium]|nr:chemotaxis protein CheW [Pseudomonadota bacterium]MBU1547181.1 chemotaxis protein CheW [Pseudomonadota bacterium]MBU2620173.1 chemotaxis protein CheW [Pseudomonadota bacterium]